MTKYNSKIGPTILIFLIAILGGLSLLMIYSKIWSGLAILLGVLVFIIYIFSTTYYIIKDKYLIVKSGCLVNKTISIDSIKHITPSNNLVSSPALSLDRLKIEIQGRDSVLISPINKHAFINQLSQINAEIKVKRK